MRRQSRARRVAVAASAAVLAAAIASGSAPLAQRGGGGGTVLLPATASSIVRRPADFLDRTVSMMAAVDEMLSETVFTVDQDRTRSTGEAVLVIAPTLQRAVDPGDYLTVQGRVLRFDPAAIARQAEGYTLDLAPEVVEAYRGRPAVLATVVLTADLVDLARVPPPPMTPAEEAFDGVMKQVGAANGALRAGLQAGSAGQVQEPLNTLATAFGEVERFFSDRGAEDAVGFARQAQGFVETITKAVAAGNWDEAATSSASLAQVCSSCHAAHRVQLEDGSYRVRRAGGGR